MKNSFLRIGALFFTGVLAAIAASFDPQTDFENGNFPLVVVAGSIPSFTSVSAPTIPFSRVVLSSGLTECISDFIPVRAGETLYGEIWAMRASGSSGNAGTLYFGIARYDKDKKVIAGNLALDYFAASAVVVPQNSTWEKYSGLVELPISHTPYDGSDGGAVRYVRAYIIVNYTSGTIPTYWGGVSLRSIAPFGDAAALVFNGNVGIGTTNPTQKLSVNGAVRAKEVIVDSGWSDYVFDEGYKLKALSETAAFIKSEKHLPGMPSAKEVAEHGVSVGEMQAKLLAKIEELTLHQIEQAKHIEAVEAENALLRTRLSRLENSIQ